MQRGRPAAVQDEILKFAAEQGGVIDLQLHRDELVRRTQTTNLPAALHRLREKNLLHTIQRGRYLLNVDRRPSRRPRLEALDPLAEIILRRLEVDWYLSWHSALWHYGLIDQQASQLYVAVRGRKRPARVGRNRVRFVSVVERKFFSFEEIDDFGWPVQMAKPEKAIVDSFDHPRLVGPMPAVASALRAAWQMELIDPEVLVKTALDFKSYALNRRLGFFMDFYGIPGAEPLELRLGRDWAVPLAPGGRLDGEDLTINPRWRVAEDPVVLVAARSQR